MQAHVKMRHIKIDIKGDIHPKIITALKEIYGNKVEFIKDDDDEAVDVFKTDWYKKISKHMTPGKNMRIYRELNKLTQEQLGEKLGGVTRQNISHMERDVRPISIKVAKKLSHIFKVSVERFI
jgi:DNA-binding XRE family transcriptional regulator